MINVVEAWDKHSELEKIPNFKIWFYFITDNSEKKDYDIVGTLNGRLTKKMKEQARQFSEDVKCSFIIRSEKTGKEYLATSTEVKEI